MAVPMVERSESPKRRGRPRLSDEERKRHTMTFRMRTDLRAAVEELAQANGRSLSEQIEYYVEASVRSEAALIYEYSTDAMSPTLFKALTGHDAPEGGLQVRFPVNHHTMVNFGGKHLSHGLVKVPHHGSVQNHHSAKSNIHSKADAVALASVLFKAVQHGAIEALGEALGSEVIDALNSSTILLGADAPLHRASEQYRMHVRCADAEAEVERLRKENRELREAAGPADQPAHPASAARGGVPKGMSLMADLSRTASEDFLEAVSVMGEVRKDLDPDRLNCILEKAHGKFVEASTKQLKCFYMLGAVEVCGGELIEEFLIEDHRQEEMQQQGCILASRIVKSREEPFPLMETFSERWRMFGAADARERFEETRDRKASRA